MTGRHIYILGAETASTATTWIASHGGVALCVVSVISSDLAGQVSGTNLAIPSQTWAVAPLGEITKQNETIQPLLLAGEISESSLVPSGAYLLTAPCSTRDEAFEYIQRALQKLTNSFPTIYIKKNEQTTEE